MFFLSHLLSFWIYHPAFYYGFSTLLGCYAYFYPSPVLILPCLSLWLPFCLSFRHIKHLVLNIFLFCSIWFYTCMHYQFPLIPEEGSHGTAYVQIDHLSKSSTVFGQRWLYRCRIHQFSSYTRTFPCVITLPITKVPPLANQDYWITGTLLPTTYGYRLKPDKKLDWQPIKRSWSTAEKRYQWKQAAIGWIQKQFAHEISAKFIAGLVTGEFHDVTMREQFAYFGLQHLLAISGFHFALIASFLNICLRCLRSPTYRLWILLICLSAYCFFLGPQPSILRAWIVCVLTVGGELIHKKSNSLNNLGAALLILCLWNPLFCLDVGFQLSFAVTFAILIFAHPAQLFFRWILTKRSLKEVLLMNPLNQLAYCILTFFREGMALTCAVNLFAFPLTLYYFHQFPLMGLLYNLFFPLLASVSLGLLFIGILSSPLPGIKTIIHTLNDSYTFYILKLTDSISIQEQAYLTVNSMPSFLLTLYLCTLGIVGIIGYQSIKSEFIT